MSAKASGATWGDAAGCLPAHFNWLQLAQHGHPAWTPSAQWNVPLANAGTKLICCYAFLMLLCQFSFMPLYASRTMSFICVNVNGFSDESPAPFPSHVFLFFHKVVNTELANSANVFLLALCKVTLKRHQLGFKSDFKDRDKLNYLVGLDQVTNANKCSYNTNWQYRSLG